LRGTGTHFTMVDSEHSQGRERSGTERPFSGTPRTESGTTMNDEPTVFVVDSDEATRDAVRDLADTMNVPCEAYTSGREFLDTYDVSRPGCVVLDVRITDVSGLDVLECLAKRGAVIPFVFVAGYASVSIAVRTMRAGAMHFLEKPFREHELWDAIREGILLDGKRRGTLAKRRQIEERLTKLTPKQRQVLEMIAEGKSKQVVAAEAGVSLRTVEVRRKHIMKTLGLDSTVGLVHFALMACNGHSEAIQKTTGLAVPTR